MRLSLKTNNNQATFGSNNHPIKPFEIQTSKGKLFVRELKAQDCSNDKEMYDYAKMMVDNFIDGSTDPRWKQYQEPLNIDKYQQRIQSFIEFTRDTFIKDDGNTNFLLAEDNKKNIRAGIITFGFDEFKVLNDPKTCYLDSIVVDNLYRHNNVGEALINKIIVADNREFSDMFITAYNKAKPFYEKLGFKELDLKNPIIKTISDIIQKERDDVPEFVTLMSKVLDEHSIRWWERLSKIL